jgi:hypothetical protein
MEGIDYGDFDEFNPVAEKRVDVHVYEIKHFYGTAKLVLLDLLGKVDAGRFFHFIDAICDRFGGFGSARLQTQKNAIQVGDAIPDNTFDGIRFAVFHRLF